MTEPTPQDGAPAEAGDTFDFGTAQRRAQVYLKRTLDRAEGTSGLSKLPRDQFIAVGAVGGFIVAPVLAGIRKKRRRKAKRRKAQDS